jgi:lipoteichoic acid synthase
MKNFFEKIETPVKLTWVLFFIFALVRILEFLSLPEKSVSQTVFNYFTGLRYDFLFASIAGIIMIFVFLILPRKTHKVLLSLSGVVILFLAIISWGLTEFYLSTHIPLDNSILVYPINEIIHIVSSSESISFVMIMKAAVVIAATIAFVWFFVPRIKLSPGILLVSLIPIIIVLGFFYNITPDITKFKRNKPFYQQINKASYFSKSLLKQMGSDSNLTGSDVLFVSNDFHELMNDQSYSDPAYPFIRENDHKDVIGRFFNFREEEPNFVFIIVESLSRNFSGPGSNWGSFTPFLDSLAQHSLYWENFLSTSERTFNVLPSAFASLPYASKGFMAIIEEGRVYPDFISLPEILSQADYYYNFFYGGWAYFDYMEAFLNHLSVDYILDDNKFGSTYEKMPDTGEGYSWGYPDDAVFRRSMEIIDSFPASPRMDIYMTLNMHQPFSTPDPERWQNAYTDHMKTIDTGKFGDEFYNNRQLQFSSILYTDGSIRKLLQEYSKRPEYDNTIFFILGDHHLQMHDFNPIEKYHVPLIIYSPMLNTSKKFPAVSSVGDLTPTIAAMMKTNFQLHIPQKTHWLGNPLDTLSNFRSKNFVPFMRINRNIDELLWDEYFYSEGRLFMIDEHLNLFPFEDRKKLNLLEKQLSNFRILNNYVCNENKLHNREHE